MKVAECRGLAPLARRHALVSTEARLACPVDIPNLRLAIFDLRLPNIADRLSAICIPHFALKMVPAAGLAPALTRV